MLARGSASWLLTAGLLTAALLLYALPRDSRPLWLLAALAILVFALLLNFFRDPERRPGEGIVSPADGRVTLVDEVEDPDLGRCHRVAIFMSPLDVHVNRAPVAGTVARAVHAPGRHVPAFRKESERNERFVIVYEGEVRAKTVQIAGALARRIVPYVREGQRVERGQRIGLIRLGSRVDLLVPVAAAAPSVRTGSRARAGVTTLLEPLHPP